MRVGARAAAAQRDAFVAGLAKGLSVSAAAAAAGVTRAVACSWRERHPGMAQAWDAAIESATDRLEDEARRRGIAGDEKPSLRGGRQVGDVTQYSDAMLIRLLKARLPQRYCRLAAGETAESLVGPGTRLAVARRRVAR